MNRPIVLQRPMQWSIHPPNSYICQHLAQLLPTWSCPVASVLVVLQQSQTELQHRSPFTERQKAELRQQFLDFGYPIAAQLQQQGHLADLFDPRTGLPLLSQSGRLALDDVAVVRACLNYATVAQQGCSVILHPTWGSSVYPSTLLSSATPAELERVVSPLHIHAQI